MLLLAWATVGCWSAGGALTRLASTKGVKYSVVCEPPKRVRNKKEKKRNKVVVGRE